MNFKTVLNSSSVKKHGPHAEIATSVDVSVMSGAKPRAIMLIIVDICKYPDVFKYARHEILAIPSPHQVAKLVDTPTVYSPDDMQLFHHYLISAYPCIPHDFEEIWTRDVPRISHQVST